MVVLARRSTGPWEANNLPPDVVVPIARRSRSLQRASIGHGPGSLSFGVPGQQPTCSGPHCANSLVQRSAAKKPPLPVAPCSGARASLASQLARGDVDGVEKAAGGSLVARASVSVPRPVTFLPAGVVQPFSSKASMATSTTSSQVSPHTTPPTPLVQSSAVRPCASAATRWRQKVLIIECGFGRLINPRQAQIMCEAGFQVQFVEALPNPETPGCQVVAHMGILADAIEEFKPDLLLCASKGAPYMMAAWELGVWRGPSVMINRHPTLQSLPQNVRIVLCQGSRDETYLVRSRTELEDLVRTASPNHALLYFTGDGGICGGYDSKRAREGDTHNQESLLRYDCLPRLADAAMAMNEAPDMHLMRSWVTLAISPTRLHSEAVLGYSPEMLKSYWTTDMPGVRVVEVPSSTSEHSAVTSVFWAQPNVERDYDSPEPGVWSSSRILHIHRVENSQQASAMQTHCRALQRSLQDQGVVFEPGLHTRWAFHGTSGIDAIIWDPMGFRVSQHGGRTVWGLGTYFARDAEYCCDGGFCPTASDGTRKLLLCLIVIGIPCLGDPAHAGALPQRQGQHRFNSAVDSLSNPEVFITHCRGSAYPAYVVTFV